MNIRTLALSSEKRITIVLFVTALVLYAPGVWWGLPHATAPDRVKPWGSDELSPLGPVAELYSVFVDPDPTFNPQYPLFQYFMQAIVVGPYVLFLWLTGGVEQASVEYAFGLTDPVTSLAVMTLLARSVSILMAGGVVVAAYKTGAILWDRRTGLIASVLVLLTYPMFYYARTSNVDMGALFWTSLGLAVYAAILAGSLIPRLAVWLGIFAGLATATKDPSYAAFAIIAPVLLITHLRGQRTIDVGSWRAWKPVFFGMFSFLGVYVVASGLLFHAGRYAQHLRFITHGSEAGRGLFYFSTPETLHGNLSLLGKTVGHLVDALGAPMAILALLGLVLCIFRAPRRLMFAIPALGILLGVIIPVQFVLFRFVIIIAYVLALFAAYGLSSALRSEQPLIHRIAQLSFVVVLTFSLLRGADLTYQMINDSRYAMARWFRQNARSGDRIGYYGTALKLPPLNFGIVTVPMPGQLVSVPWPEASEDPPEFVVIIPQQPFEPVHEWTLAEKDYQALQDGSTGYQRVLTLQSPSLFARRPVSFVNPPVQIFARQNFLASRSNR